MSRFVLYFCSYRHKLVLNQNQQNKLEKITAKMLLNNENKLFSHFILILVNKLN